jgi:DNA-binding phage protein
MTTEATRNGDSGSPGHGDKSRLREKAIAALLSARSLAQAAKKAGLSKATLYRWMQEPDFKAALRGARRDVVDATIGRLQAVTTEAVTALHAALTCDAPTVRVSAARAILEFSFRSVELMDLEERLSALEQRMIEKGGDS